MINFAYCYLEGPFHAWFLYIFSLFQKTPILLNKQRNAIWNVSYIWSIMLHFKSGHECVVNEFCNSMSSYILWFIYVININALICVSSYNDISENKFGLILSWIVISPVSIKFWSLVLVNEDLCPHPYENCVSLVEITHSLTAISYQLTN